MPENDISPENATPDRGSPVPGCAILATILTVFGGLILLYTFVGIYQYRAIGTFAEDTAAEIVIPPASPDEVEASLAKLRLIEEAVKEERSERVLFTASDLNILISTLDAAKDFRGNTRIEEIGPEGIVARMTQPLRKGPFQKGFRYLNGTFVFQPDLRVRTVAFRVVSIRPSKGSVPEDFVKSYAILDLFRLDPETPAMKAHAPWLTAVYTEEGQLVVETGSSPREEP